MSRWLDGLPWAGVALACATLGLAPFLPMPHVVEKLGMLARGALAAKAVVAGRRRSEA